MKRVNSIQFNSIQFNSIIPALDMTDDEFPKGGECGILLQGRNPDGRGFLIFVGHDKDKPSGFRGQVFAGDYQFRFGLKPRLLQGIRV